MGLVEVDAGLIGGRIALPLRSLSLHHFFGPSPLPASFHVPNPHLPLFPSIFLPLLTSPRSSPARATPQATLRPTGGHVLDAL